MVSTLEAREVCYQGFFTKTFDQYFIIVGYYQKSLNFLFLCSILPKLLVLLQC